MNAKSEIACSNNDPDDACSKLSIKVSCKDIEDAGGVAIEGSGWTVGFVFRVTTDDASSGDFTAMDFPVQFSTHANGGTFKVNTKLSDLICVIPCNLPDTCTTWAVRSAHVIDPDGKAFATIGSSSR
jgi:hypothetical protein